MAMKKKIGRILTSKEIYASVKKLTLVSAVMNLQVP